MNDKDLDELLSDDFLKSLEATDGLATATEPEPPSWVTNDKEHDSYKAWAVILKLKNEKNRSIEAYKKRISNNTPASVYKIKKSEVAAAVGKAPQNLFRGKADFCSRLVDFLDAQNKVLLTAFESEQEKLQHSKSATGLRAKKKKEIVGEYQVLRDIVTRLRRKHVKDTIDLAISRMPLDLQEKLRK